MRETRLNCGKTLDFTALTRSLIFDNLTQNCIEVNRDYRQNRTKNARETMAKEPAKIIVIVLGKKWTTPQFLLKSIECFAERQNISVSVRVSVQPALLEWAIKRSRLPADVGDSYSDWIEGSKQPTLNQLTDFSKKFMVPLGCLFLETPPEESLAIADFRTLDGTMPRNPSPNLLDTFYVNNVLRYAYDRSCGE